MLNEWGIGVHHTIIFRWVLHYGLELYKPYGDIRAQLMIHGECTKPILSLRAT